MKAERLIAEWDRLGARATRLMGKLQDCCDKGEEAKARAMRLNAIVELLQAEILQTKTEHLSTVVDLLQAERQECRDEEKRQEAKAERLIGEVKCCCREWELRLREVSRIENVRKQKYEPQEWERRAPVFESERIYQEAQKNRRGAALERAEEKAEHDIEMDSSLLNGHAEVLRDQEGDGYDITCRRHVTTY